MKKLLFLVLFAHTLFAQPIYHFDLLKDINSRTNDARIISIKNVGNTCVIFQMDKDITTAKVKLRLWKSNGTSMENFASSDLFYEFTNFFEPIIIDNYLFFCVQNNGPDSGLYIAELDSPIIRKIADIIENPMVVKLNSEFYYGYYTAFEDGKLYHYNAVSNQSREIQGANLSFSNPRNLTVVNNKLFFTATTGDESEYRYQLWVSDGTNTGTRIVKELAPGGAMLGHLSKIGNGVIYDAFENSSSFLYISDGTTVGTHPFKSLYSFHPYYYATIQSIHNFGNKAVLLLNSSSSQAWVTDGTEAGTRFLDNAKSLGITGNNEAVTKDGNVFFVNSTGQLIKSDGNTNTVLKSSDMIVPFQENFKTVINPADNNLYFSLGAKFYKTDGTMAGTQLISDKLYENLTASRNTPFVLVSNKILSFTTPGLNSKFGKEIYEIRSDTIRLVKDLDPTTRHAEIEFLLNANEKTYFFAEEDKTSYSKYFETDGTPQGTRSATTQTYGYNQHYVSLNGQLYLLMNSQLQRINFTTQTNEIIRTFPQTLSSINPVQTNAKFYFVLASYGSSTTELWVSDGTINGTVKISEFRESERFQHFAIYNQQLYVFTTAGSTTKIWKYTNDTSLPILVKTINSHPVIRTYSSFRNKLTFVIATESAMELWATDGTSGGTILLNSFPLSWESSPDYLYFTDNYYYYSAFADNNTKVWKSDGTPAGTALIADISEARTNVREFCQCNNDIFFIVERDGFYMKSTLYKNPINANTSTFLNTVGALDYNIPVNLYCLNRQLYFSGIGNGLESDRKFLYTSDGTPEGTRNLLTLENRPNLSGSSRGGYLYPLNNHELLVLTNDKFYGQEWFTFRKCEPVLTNLDGIATDSKIQTSPTFIESTEKITAENKVYYYAPKSITLNAGFTANSQSVFKAEIKNRPCTIRQ